MANVTIPNLPIVTGLTGAEQFELVQGGTSKRATTSQIGSFVTTGGGFSLAVGTTGINGGSDTRVLYDNAGTLGEYPISGSGSVAMTNSPSLTTPNIGTPSAGTLTNCTGLPLSTGVTGNLGVANGGTGSDLSATGGTSQVLQQTSAGAAITVGQLAASNLSNGTTGSGSVVLATSPTLVTPALGTPASGTLTNCTGLPISTGVSGLGSGVATFLATPSSANLAAAVSDETGSGALVFATSPTLVTPALGTPSSGTLTNCTGLPVGAITGLGANVATFLATPSSANLAAAVSDETGSGALVFATSPTLVTPALGTPSSGTLTNCTGLPISTGVSGLGSGVATFLATPSSANLASAVTDETGSGALMFGTSPRVTTDIAPATNDGAALGTTLLQWSDLYLASGGVINWANGNVTLTHSSGNLTVAGATVVSLGTSAAFTTGTIELGAASDTTLARASAGVVSVEGIQLLKANGNQTITGGFAVTPNNLGTVSSGTTTPDPANGNYQYYTNNGAHTLAAPSSDCAIDLLVTNGASAGSITFSGFTVGAAVGAALTTTNTNRFLISVRRINSVATYSIYALQ